MSYTVNLNISGTITMDGTPPPPPPPPEPITLPNKPLWTPAHWMYQDISTMPVDPRQTIMLQRSGGSTDAQDGLQRPVQTDFGAPWIGMPVMFGMPINLVRGTQAKVPVTFQYPGESDPGPYPIPEVPRIEQNEDRHLVILDVDAWVLYEMGSYSFDGTTHRAFSGAKWDLATWRERPLGWTSADAAGLPIYPLLVKADDVFVKKQIDHAIRVTIPRSRKALVAPARHFASSLTTDAYMPMGTRLRLKASYDVTKAPDGTAFPPEVQVILKAMKKTGMICADNGLAFFFQGLPDPRYNNDALGLIKKVKGSDLEVVQLGTVITAV